MLCTTHGFYRRLGLLWNSSNGTAAAEGFTLQAALVSAEPAVPATWCLVRVKRAEQGTRAFALATSQPERHQRLRLGLRDDSFWRDEAGSRAAPAEPAPVAAAARTAALRRGSQPVAERALACSDRTAAGPCAASGPLGLWPPPLRGLSGRWDPLPGERPPSPAGAPRQPAGRRPLRRAVPPAAHLELSGSLTWRVTGPARPVSCPLPPPLPARSHSYSQPELIPRAALPLPGNVHRQRAEPPTRPGRGPGRAGGEVPAYRQPRAEPPPRRGSPGAAPQQPEGGRAARLRTETQVRSLTEVGASTGKSDPGIHTVRRTRTRTGSGGFKKPR